jgi:hypothetical protein
MGTVTGRRLPRTRDTLASAPKNAVDVLAGDGLDELRS